MNLLRLASGTAIMLACTMVWSFSDTAAQEISGSDGWVRASRKSPWEPQQKGVEPTAAIEPAVPETAVSPPRLSGPSPARAPSPTRRTPQNWSPTRVAGPALVAQSVPPAAEIVPTPEGHRPLTPGHVPEVIDTPPPLLEGGPTSPELTGPDGPEAEDGCSCGECDPCDACSEGGHFGCRCRHECFRALLRNVTLFAGVQGFKGPMDLGQNGNFGFHEGLNFGAPLGDPWDCGFQLGFQGVHSNFSGSQTANGDLNGRDQVFFTGGVFHRAACGHLQGGVAFDYMHDNYFNQSDLKQLRSETSLVFGRWHEIGYTGNYGISRDRFTLQNGRLQFVQPHDVFAGFYRRHFTGGGQGRIWGGATGSGDGVLGADATIPLGTSWALENNFIYLIPKNGPSLGGQQQESWSVAISLVWYPGRASRCVFQNPFHPLFNVADNAAFLVRRGADQP